MLPPISTSCLTSAPRCARRTSLTPHIFTLPVELLSEVASYVSERHPVKGYVIESRSIRALADVSRTFRSIAIPYLYREMTIVSARQLHALAASPARCLALIRELNIFMDEEFLEVWKTWMAPIQNDCSQEPAQWVYRSLVGILSKTLALRALRIQVAELCGRRSAWRAFALSRAHGIPIGRALEQAFEDTPRFVLPKLRTIELDGFQEVGPLLRLSPSLETFRTSLTAGFDCDASAELIEALRSVPKLRELAYTPVTLRLESTKTVTNVDASSWQGSDLDVQLLQAIGEVLPGLEILDLQTRWHGYSIYFSLSPNPLPAEELLGALALLPRLRRLSLPCSILSQDDFTLLRSPLPVSAPETARADLYILRAAIEARQEALERVMTAERDVIERMDTVVPDLQAISFIRSIFPEDTMEYSINYEVIISSDRGGSQSTLASPSTTHPSFRCSRASIIDASYSEARDGQTHPWPFAPAVSLTQTLRRLWCAAPTTIFTSSLHDHSSKPSFGFTTGLDDYVDGSDPGKKAAPAVAPSLSGHFPFLFVNSP